MSEEREDIATDDATPARRRWSTPTLTVVAADEAAAGGPPGTADGDIFS